MTAELWRARAIQNFSNNSVIYKHSFAISRRMSPEVCQKFPYPPIRGRREYRAPMRPRQKARA
jgi:hypothetical protein